MIDVFTVSTATGTNWIRVSWRTNSQTLQQQLRSVKVMLTSQCFSGIVPPESQTFNVMPEEGNSITARGLGILFLVCTFDCSISHPSQLCRFGCAILSGICQCSDM